jgi:enoyl-CoA hydratase/carnithine racemase
LKFIPCSFAAAVQSAGMEHLLITPHDGWVQVTLNRPDAKNALNTAMLADIALALAQADADPRVRAVVIHGHNGGDMEIFSRNWILR